MEENLENLIKEMLSKKNFAVVGSFRSAEKYAYKIANDLTKKGYKVYLVNRNFKIGEEFIPLNNEENLKGLKCYPSVLDLPDDIEVVNIVTPPEVTEEIVKQCLKKGIKYVWMQPGAESENAIKFCKENNINVVYNACVMLGR
ncbi:MAG: CoA-binding protein [Candidatus Altarchaeaceae archaeon]